MVALLADDSALLAPLVSEEPRAALRVILADDHAVVLEGLKLLVNSQQDMQVVGEATNGDAAMKIAATLLPDVIVIDLSMQILGGAAATAQLSAALPSVRVVALTVHEEASYLAQLLRAGARGYVLKRSASEHLLQAIRAAGAGGTYVDPSMAAIVVQGYLRSRGGDIVVRAPRLSTRERAVLVRIAKGCTNREIARELGVSVKTVETYKARFSEKLGIRSRVDIARYAAEHRLGDARDDGVQ